MANTTIKKQLKMGFYNSLGKRHYWTPKAINENLTAEEIYQLMERMTNTKMFVKDGIAMFEKIANARYIVTEETELIEDKKDGIQVENLALKVLSSTQNVA